MDLIKTYRPGHAILRFEAIDHGGEEYEKGLALQEEILYAPLGLAFLPDDWERDKDYFHMAVFLNNTLCATAVLAPNKDACKMQRVAVVESMQRKGIGSALVQFCEAYALKKKFITIYCHARIIAIPFYQTNNYALEGQPFAAYGHLYQKMSKTLG